MQNKKSKLAFSLIELSVVILIIGILVIGISKGSRIIQSSRLASAKSLTKNSPVNLNAQDLAFWLDASADNSFGVNDTVDGASITTWNDVNPFAANSTFNFTPPGTAPTYMKNSTNGLPGVKFNTSILRKANVRGEMISEGGNQITIFIVQKQYAVPNNIASTVQWQGISRIGVHAIHTSGVFYFDFFTACCPPSGRFFFDAATVPGKAVVLSVIRRPNNTGIVRINGTQNTSSSMTDLISPSLTQTFYLGADTMVGEVNEIIVFKTALSDKQIVFIEQYLSNKWGIALKGF